MVYTPQCTDIILLFLFAIVLSGALWNHGGKAHVQALCTTSLEQLCFRCFINAAFG